MHFALRYHRAAAGLRPHRSLPFASYDVGMSISTDDLTPDPRLDAVFHRLINEITAAEGPVLLDRLVRRAFACFRIYEITPARTARLYSVLHRSRLRRGPGGIYLWPDALEPTTWTGFRRTVRPTDRRPGEITVEEMANALVHELAFHPQGIEQDLLQREALVALGHSRFSDQTFDRMVLAAEKTVREHRTKRRGMRFYPLNSAAMGSQGNAR